MVIDTHVHVWALDEEHRPAPGARIPPPREAAPVEWLLEDMAEHGIDHCVLVQSSAFGWDNTCMVECLERYPERFRAIGLVDPLSEDNADDLRRWMGRGLSGFRLHPLYYPDEPCWIDSPAHDRLWEAAAETGAILQFHLLPHHAVPLARMIARHAGVRVVVDHLGKPDLVEAPPYPSFQPVLDLARFPSVWVKIGDYQIASRQPFPWRDTIPFVALLKEAFGAGRMLWGTGYPGRARLVPLAQALRYVRQELPVLTAEEIDQILGRTPGALFGFRSAWPGNCSGSVRSGALTADRGVRDPRPPVHRTGIG
ncbi:MAG: amidohydrolase [Chloroflexi bacterium]|nr:amidohydrolase [Chloroflexota bacterium]